MIQVVCFLIILFSQFFIFFPALPMEESCEIVSSAAYANANNGHIEEMQDLIEYYLKLGGYLESKDDSAQQPHFPERNVHFKTAVEWFARYYMRMRQDAACYNDPKATADLVEDYIEQQAFAQAIGNAISKQELNKIYLDQVSWVENITDGPYFPVPVIDRYLIDPYNTRPNDSGITLRNYPIAQHACSEKREEALKEMWKQERKKELHKFKKWLTSVTQK